MWECMECGKLIKSYKVAQEGCPKCGGVDIDEAEPKPKANKQRYSSEERELEGYAKRASRQGSDFLDHDHSMDY